MCISPQLKVVPNNCTIYYSARCFEGFTTLISICLKCTWNEKTYIWIRNKGTEGGKHWQADALFTIRKIWKNICFILLNQSHWQQPPSSTPINIYLVKFTSTKCMVCRSPNEMLCLIPIPQTERNTLSLKSIHWCEDDEGLRGKALLPRWKWWLFLLPEASHCQQPSPMLACRNEIVTETRKKLFNAHNDSSSSCFVKGWRTKRRDVFPERRKRGDAGVSRFSWRTRLEMNSAFSLFM